MLPFITTPNDLPTLKRAFSFLAVFAGMATLLVSVPTWDRFSLIQQSIAAEPDNNCNQDANWLDELMAERVAYWSNLIEDGHNATCYKVRDGKPILIPPGAITAQALDASRVQTRNVARKGRRLSDPFCYLSISNTGICPNSECTVAEQYIPLAANQSIEVPLPNLQPSLYTFYLYGTTDKKEREDLPQVWQPTPMDFYLYEDTGAVVTRGKLLMKQGLSPRRLQGFAFHIPKAGNYRAVFQMSPEAKETQEIMYLTFFDHIAGIPDEALKITQNLTPKKPVEWVTLDEPRQQRDEAIWNALPPLNRMLRMEKVVSSFDHLPSALATSGIDKWETRAFIPYIEITGTYWLRNHAYYKPLDLENTATKQIFTRQQILNFDPLPGMIEDKSYGIYLTQAEYPDDLSNDIYYSKLADLLAQRYTLYFEGIIEDTPSDDKARYNLSGRCRDWEGSDESEHSNICHDAAMALIRFAYDWPALEMNLNDIERNTASPHLKYGTAFDLDKPDGLGKLRYAGHSGPNTVHLFKAYDSIFHYIKANQVLADAVHRFIPWITTPHDVIKFLDRYLVMASVRDFQRKLIRTSAVEQAAAELLGIGPYTSRLFDLTKAFETFNPGEEGRYQELYAYALTRNGHRNIGAFFDYAFGSAVNELKRAGILNRYKKFGCNPLMDISDVHKYPKIKAAGHFLFEMFTAGGYPVIAGDAGGSTHPGERYMAKTRWAAPSNKPGFQVMFDIMNDPRAAWVLKNLFQTSSPEIDVAVQGVEDDPSLHQYSRVVPASGFAVIEKGSEATDKTKKMSAILKLGYGPGHGHQDYLDLNLYGLGLPMAVDLGVRDEGKQWTRPSADNVFAHNHAHHDSGDHKGDPWLKSFGEDIMRGAFVNANGTEQLDRDVMVMEVEGFDTPYVFDIQRLRGGCTHVWSFHGAESNEVTLNISESPAEHVQELGRTLAGTRFAGIATEKLEATWTMSRENKTHKYTEPEDENRPDQDGILTQKATEQEILGSEYKANLPPARIKATLLGHGGEQVYRGNFYSDPYGYSFPFLRVKSPAKPESIYPAVYQMYRCCLTEDTPDLPLLSNIELVSTAPIKVNITANTGQVDVFTSSGETITAVSRDMTGKVRYAKLNAGTNLTDTGISIMAPTDKYTTSISDIDYNSRTLTVSSALPENQKVLIGNSGRKIYLELKGKYGKDFTFNDDLIVNEASIEKDEDGHPLVDIVNELSVAVTLAKDRVNNAYVQFAGIGNRKQAGFTQTNETGTLHFRDAKIVKKPLSTATSSVFTDANKDGFINVKTYEIGIGDIIEALTDVTIRRTTNSYEAKTNIDIEGSVEGQAFKLCAQDAWQSFTASRQEETCGKRQ